MPLGVLRKPAFEDPLLLEEHLVDGPEAGKRKAAQDGGDYGMPDKQGSAGAQKAHHQPHPPRLPASSLSHITPPSTTIPVTTVVLPTTTHLFWLHINKMIY